MQIVEGPMVDTPERKAKLAEYARVLKQRLDTPPRGYVMGKTAARNALMSHYRCSAVVGEEVIDELEARGYLRFSRPRRGEPHRWTLTAHPKDAVSSIRPDIKPPPRLPEGPPVKTPLTVDPIEGSKC